jgi:hypothetical protein
LIYGDRHLPMTNKESVWLKIRADGHSVWPCKRDA